MKTNYYLSNDGKCKALESNHNKILEIYFSTGRKIKATNAFCATI